MMPNDANISAPLTLIGLGRSGTSLFQAAFAKHPEFQICGETGGIIFSVWQGAKATFMPIPQAYWSAFESDENAKCVYYVREVIKSLCPSDAKYWFHKPAGLPVKHLNRRRIPGQRGKLSHFPVEWYWNILSSLYADGKIITIIRNPFDIMMSRKEHSRWAFKDTWKDIVATYEIYQCEHQRLDQIIMFDDLINNFEATIRNACMLMGVPFEPVMLEALSTNQAETKGRGPMLTHQNTWHALDGFEVDVRALHLIRGVWEKWGWDLHIPKGVNCVETGEGSTYNN